MTEMTRRSFFGSTLAGAARPALTLRVQLRRQPLHPMA